jgi:hypothetical protein
MRMISSHIPLISLLISAGGLVVAINSQRIAKKAAERAGRLKAINISKAATESVVGFDAVNGPNDVTLATAHLRVRYSLTTSKGFRRNRQLVFDLRHTCFSLIGIVGPSFPHRFIAYDQVGWRLSRHALQLQALLENPTCTQCVQVQLRLKASGETAASKRLTLGTVPTRFRFREVANLGEIDLIEALELFSAQPERIGLHKWMLGLINYAVRDIP